MDNVKFHAEVLAIAKSVGLGLVKTDARVETGIFGLTSPVYYSATIYGTPKMVGAAPSLEMWCDDYTTGEACVEVLKEKAIEYKALQS